MSKQGNVFVWKVNLNGKRFVVGQQSHWFDNRQTAATSPLYIHTEAQSVRALRWALKTFWQQASDRSSEQMFHLVPSVCLSECACATFLIGYINARRIQDVHIDSMRARESRRSSLI